MTDEEKKVAEEKARKEEAERKAAEERAKIEREKAPKPDDPKPSAADELLAKARQEKAELAARHAQLEKEHKALKDREAEAERKRLEEEGKYRELAEREAARVKEIEAENVRIRNETSQSLISSEIRLALIREGVLDPDVHTLVDRSSITVDGSSVQGAQEAVTAFKTAKPHLFGTAPSSTSPPGAPPPKPSNTDKAKPLDVRNMSREDYQAKKTEFLRSLRGGRR